MTTDELCVQRFINVEFNTKNIRMNIMEIRSHYVSVLVYICFVWMIVDHPNNPAKFSNIPNIVVITCYKV